MRRFPIGLLVLILLACWSSSTRTLGQAKANVNQTALEEAGQVTPEISTEELKKILKTGSEPVLDARSTTEYAIAHIPGSINVYEKEVERAPPTKHA